MPASFRVRVSEVGKRVRVKEEIEPGVFVLDPVRVEKPLSDEILSHLPPEGKILLGLGNDEERQRRRIRTMSARMEEVIELVR